MIRVLFVCWGNICRSPMAEFIFKNMVEEEGLADLFHIESRATHTDEIYNGYGNPVYPPAKAKLKEHGISCEGKRAILLKKEDYDNFDYIIGMDELNKKWMPKRLGGDPDNKISLLLDYTDNPRSVADPWYTGNFDITYNDVVEGCTAFLTYLRNNGLV